MLEYKSINTISGTCGYVKLGAGHPLIMIVGYSGTLFHWHSGFVNELAKHYTVYLVDNRKIGLSNSDNEESIGGFAKDIVDFIDAMALEHPYILGWSMGGVAVQELLKSYPNKISVAILMATVPQISDTNPKFLTFIASASDMSVEEFKNGLYYFFFSHYQYDKAKDELTTNALNFTNYHYRFEPNARILQDAAIAKWSGMNANDLAHIKVPALLLWAENDQVVPKKSALFLESHLALPTLIVYSGGGHFLLQENHKKIANDIISFISHQIC